MMLTIDEALSGAKQMKEGSDWTDTVPLMHTFHTNGQQNVVAMPEMGSGPEAWANVGMAAVQLRIADGPMEGAITVLDARMRVLEKGQERPEVDELQKKWLAGDRDGIVECMFVTLMRGDGSYEVISQPYDADTQTWDEPTRMSSDDPDVVGGGGMLDALRLGVASVAPDGSIDQPLQDYIDKMHAIPLLREAAKAQFHQEPIDPDDIPVDAEIVDDTEHDPDRVVLKDYLNEGDD